VWIVTKKAILIDNAVVYNTEGGDITLETERKKEMFVLHISNTGVVLDGDDKKHLFKQSFFRTKEARKVNPAGMGVGLLVAKTIIEAHRGRIALESSEEGRTAFVVALPLVK